MKKRTKHYIVEIIDVIRTIIKLPFLIPAIILGFVELYISNPIDDFLSSWEWCD